MNSKFIHSIEELICVALIYQKTHTHNFILYDRLFYSYAKLFIINIFQAKTADYLFMNAPWVTNSANCTIAWVTNVFMFYVLDALWFSCSFFSSYNKYYAYDTVCCWCIYPFVFLLNIICLWVMCKRKKDDRLHWKNHIMPTEPENRDYIQDLVNKSLVLSDNNK